MTKVKQIPVAPCRVCGAEPEVWSGKGWYCYRCPNLCIGSLGTKQYLKSASAPSQEAAAQKWNAVNKEEE